MNRQMTEMNKMLCESKKTPIQALFAGYWPRWNTHMPIRLHIRTCLKINGSIWWLVC